jgi:hypothetical protein
VINKVYKTVDVRNLLLHDRTLHFTRCNKNNADNLRSLNIQRMQIIALPASYKRFQHAMTLELGRIILHIRNMQ